MPAAALVRARYWSKHAPLPAPQPAAPPPPPPTPPPSTKLRYHLRNWKHYTQALRGRASLTLWLEQDTITAWYGDMRVGKLGHPTTFSDIAIRAIL